MSVTVNWYLEDHIIYITHDKLMSVEAIEEATRQSIALAQQSSVSRIHLIIDNRMVEAFNFNLNDMRNLFVQFPFQDRGGYVIMLNRQNSKFAPALHMIATLTTQFLDVRFRFFDSPEMAVNFLCEVDDEVASAINCSL